MQAWCEEEAIVDRPDYETLSSYELNGPVYPEGFESWSKSRADKYCDWVKCHFESRRHILKSIIFQLAGDSIGEYGTESYLMSILPLLDDHVKYHYVNLDDSLENTQYHALIQRDNPFRVPTYQTLSLSVDVAVVFADTFKLCCPRSEWIVFKRGRTFFNNNRLCVAVNGVPIAEPVTLGPQLLARKYRGDNHVERIFRTKVEYYNNIFGDS